jgi:hypothetical protein
MAGSSTPIRRRRARVCDDSLVFRLGDRLMGQIVKRIVDKLQLKLIQALGVWPGAAGGQPRLCRLDDCFIS